MVARRVISAGTSLRFTITPLYLWVFLGALIAALVTAGGAVHLRLRSFGDKLDRLGRKIDTLSSDFKDLSTDFKDLSADLKGLSADLRLLIARIDGMQANMDMQARADAKDAAAALAVSASLLFMGPPLYLC